MKNKKNNLFFKRILKIFLFFILPPVVAYLISIKTTGFSVNSEAGVVAGSFLGIFFVFFIILLVLIKLGIKIYKPTKIQ
ncbi:MAG: hypothetical protein ABIH59_00595 [archaeon]